MKNKLSKIIATIGPASDNKETIKELINNGVNVFRFNMKHGTLDWHHERILRVKHLAEKMETPISILLDLQGPELRIETPDHEDFPVKKGETINITYSFIKDLRSLCLPHHVVFETVKVGDQILVDDGFVEFIVVEIQADRMLVEAVEDGVVKHRKGVNLPGRFIKLPSLIEADLQRLDLACNHDVDFIALSFTQTKDDVKLLKSEMDKRKIKADIIAKIESNEGLTNIDEIIDEANGIMIARGDLGIEVPIERLANWQKRMVHKCRLAHKPVIVATQMLQSMIDCPRPTRAEATDVANAVFDGTDAVMLSGETANGKYPVKAVQAMAKIVKYNETKAHLVDFDCQPQNNVELIIHAAVAMIDCLNHPKIDKIVVFTDTGQSAKILSSFHPDMPIIAVTSHKRVVGRLNLCYGVKPYYFPFPSGTVIIPNPVMTSLKRKKIIVKDERVMVIHGQHWKKPGLTNALAIVKV